VIVAEHHPLFTPFWQWYILESLRGHFDTVQLHLDAPDTTPTPTLWHATHVSWWDGYLGLALARHLNLEFRVMMLEENLAKYRFLRFAGAFGLQRGNSRGTLESFRYAVNELQNESHAASPRGLLMFPAGEIGSPYLRPAPYESGAASLALQAAKTTALNVRALAIRLEYLGAAKPTALLRVSAPRVVRDDLKTPELTALMRADLEREADALQADLRANRLEGYVPMVRGRSSVQQGWDEFRRRIGLKV
jgi:1-acyl-sn-glycerol-3-phosphate acyltransferase